MKLSFLVGNLGGGTGDHLLSMMRLWPREHRIEIVSEAALTSRITPNATLHFTGGQRWWEHFPLAQAARCYAAARLARRFRPDVVHAYFFWSIVYGRVLKRLGVIRALVENREDEGLGWGPREYALLRRTVSLPDRVICVSEAVRRVVVEREGLDPDRVTVVRNGIGEPDAVGRRDEIRSELGLPLDAPVVGMVSNLNRPVKGVEHFLRSIPLIRRSVPDARFVIFGKGFGESPEEQRLLDLAAELGIGEFTRFAGFRPDIHRYYCAFDVSVLTSLSEGLPIVLLESMIQGLPVVATAVGGSPEVVEDGVTGYLVPPKDPRAFAERVTELLLDEALRARMGEAGRRRARTEFDIAATASRYLEIYRAVSGATAEG